MIVARTMFIVSVNLVNNFLGFVYMWNGWYYFITYYGVYLISPVYVTSDNNLQSVAQSAAAVC
jgi:hypothetical protein